MTDTGRLEEIFSEAMRLPQKEARGRFVEQACEGDAELAHHVSALLEAAEEAGSFLASPAHRGGRSETEFSALAAPIVAGDMGSLGPYRILQRVGRGGMGIVYRAIDPRLERVVAIKVLAPEIAIDPMARLRFQREARSAAAVNHPHVVVIHAVDEAHYPPYLVMEYVQGKTLADKLAKHGLLPIREALRIGSQIAEGLAGAHRQGLVHRDIKPSNILLENCVERVKISDFGLAKTVDDVGMTRTGDLSGTPQYMSPEQASGSFVDHRTDLFSLGAILYTMCTGRPPFRAEHPFALLKRICEDTPRPISQLNPEVPDWLSAIVDRLLMKSPADRFQTAAEVGALLQQHLAMIQEGPGSARPTLNRRRLWPWPLLAFGLLAGVGFLAWFGPQRAPRTSSSIAGGQSQPRQSAPGDGLPDAPETMQDVSSRGEAEHKTSGLASAPEDAPHDPFEGMNAGDRRVLTDLNLAFRWCPPGRFLMGSPPSEVGNSVNERQVEVTVPRGFWTEETEVTQSEWAQLMGSLPSHAMDKGKGDRCPIYCVSLEEAAAFCRKLTEIERNANRLPLKWEYRLPTEAQWEYACRAGTTTATAFGDQLSSTQANFGGDWPHNGAPKGPSLQRAVKVGSYLPNAWGLYDMHGNVKEFTATPGRVRGGSWCDSGRNCCSAIYIPDSPDPHDSVGFRMVLVSVQ